jgi:plastocyanin
MRGIIIMTALVLAGCTYLPEQSAVEGVTGETESAVENGAEIVRIFSGGFAPREIEVNKGTEVIWVNIDRADHTVSFSSIPVDADVPSGAQASHVFDETGSFEYASSKDGQRGHIIVQ